MKFLLPRICSVPLAATLGFAAVLTVAAFAAERVVPSQTITSGQNVQESHPEIVRTTGSTIQIQSGGKAAFAAGGQVVLSAGFHVQAGGMFRASRDLNFGGLASLADTDIDGLPDEWELLHFGNLAAASGNGDNDGDGILNSVEYLLGSNPNLNDNSGAIGSFQVVVRLPNGKYRGVTSSWDLNSAP